MEKEIVIKPNFAVSDFFKLNLFLYVTSIGFFIFLIIEILILSFFTYNFIIGKFELFDILLIYFISLILYPMFICLMKYIQTKRSLEDPRLKENITFKFNKEQLEDIGESYSRKFKYSELLKIKETKGFFLIYITKQMIKPIIKADLKDNQYNELKELFNSLKIKKSLK